MKHFFAVWALFAGACAAAVVACSSDDRRGLFSSEGGVSPGSGGKSASREAGPADAETNGGAGGAPLPLGSVMCGDAVCGPGTSSVSSSGCCTDSGVCGYRIVLSMKCLEKNEPGRVDSRCTPYEIPGKLMLPGCCSPSGCGVLATFDGIGCIPNPDLARDVVACTPDIPF